MGTRLFIVQQYLQVLLTSDTYNENVLIWHAYTHTHTLFFSLSLFHFRTLLTLVKSPYRSHRLHTKHYVI